MDLVCTTCGEPWDMDYVLHEEPESFERVGGNITHCPCCETTSQEDISPQQREKLEIIENLAELLGDDIDGLAAEIEDLGLDK